MCAMCVQVLLRWALQRGVAVIPRSANTSHVAQNADLLGFALSEAEALTVDALEHLVASKVSQPRHRGDGDHFGILDIGL